MYIKKYFEYNAYKSEYDNQFKLLRILTLKSKFGFGQYREYTVEKLLQINSDCCKPTNYPFLLGDQCSYLRWVYFNSSNITFIDSILDTIGIYEKYRIKKPGKNYELYYILEKYLDETFLPENFKKRWQSKHYYDKEKFLNDKPESKYILRYDDNK